VGVVVDMAGEDGVLGELGDGGFGPMGVRIGCRVGGGDGCQEGEKASCGAGCGGDGLCDGALRYGPSCSDSEPESNSP
jgi:hypothetical protein